MHFPSTKHPQRGISGPSTKQHTHLVSYELLFTKLMKKKKKKKCIYIERESAVQLKNCIHLSM